MKLLTAKFPDKRILVAEDYIVNQELTKEMLQIMECIVEVADDGVAAFDLFKEGGFDLVLMDMQMPEMDGYAATKKIREFEEITGTHTPIIAITANALSGDREKCLASGTDDYISKPIKGETLEQILTKYLS